MWCTKYAVNSIHNCCYQMIALQLEMFGAIGGELSTRSHGFTLHIPPGALEEDKQISLQVLTEIPNGLTLKDDEILVSHGFQCYPSGLSFKKPAKLIIPHCALVTDPNKYRLYCIPGINQVTKSYVKPFKKYKHFRLLCFFLFKADCWFLRTNWHIILLDLRHIDIGLEPNT